MSRGFKKVIKYILIFASFGFITFVVMELWKAERSSAYSSITPFINDGVEPNKNFWWLKQKLDPYKEYLMITSPPNISQIIAAQVPISFMNTKKSNDNIIEDRNYNSSSPGEMGMGVFIEEKSLSIDELRKFKKGWENHAFNEYASDMISVRRHLPDYRHKSCLSHKYKRQLPKTSIVICFHNEAFSTLLRTVHSILDRTPAKLLEEIILVDDKSTMDHLFLPLESYMRFFNKVKIIRNKIREGLIRSRLFGARVAKAEVLTFLDSHVECTQGWLEPLLDKIAQNWSNVPVPVIDIIDDKNFALTIANPEDVHVGGFDWGLQFKWQPVPERENNRRKLKTNPVRSPTMPGGLFSISKRYFEYLGAYDPGFDIWGGENLELSFKIWMCGGTLEIIPCSHVGHVFRIRSPYSWNEDVNVLKKNLVRLAEVWLDNYKMYFYSRLNFELGDYGDISERKKLRKRLKCKSFKWYLENIYPEQFIPGEALRKGNIRNRLFGLCLDASTNDLINQNNVILYPCHNRKGNQDWILSKQGEIRRDDDCMDFNGSNSVTVYPCHGYNGSQQWTYTKFKQIRHVVYNKCMEVDTNNQELTMRQCANIDTQQWIWRRSNPNP